MLSRLSVLALLTISASTALAQDKQPISNMTCDELLAFYDKLPFTDVLPLDAARSLSMVRSGRSQLVFRRPASTTLGALPCFRRSRLKPAGIRTSR